jgi:hypothetical protein
LAEPPWPGKGQGGHGHKAVAHAGKAGKQHGKRLHGKHAGKHYKNK